MKILKNGFHIRNSRLTLTYTLKSERTKAYTKVITINTFYVL